MHLDEQLLTHPDGYRGRRPVRIGHDAQMVQLLSRASALDEGDLLGRDAAGCLLHG